MLGPRKYAATAVVALVCVATLSGCALRSEADDLGRWLGVNGSKVKQIFGQSDEVVSDALTKMKGVYDNVDTYCKLAGGMKPSGLDPQTMREMWLFGAGLSQKDALAGELRDIALEALNGTAEPIDVYNAAALLTDRICPGP